MEKTPIFFQKISGEVIVSSIPKNLEVGVIGRILGIVCARNGTCATWPGVFLKRKVRVGGFFLAGGICPRDISFQNHEARDLLGLDAAIWFVGIALMLLGLDAWLHAIDVCQCTWAAVATVALAEEAAEWMK